MLKDAKTYSIGEVANMFNLSVPTLRYYDKENLIPNLQKTESGIRQFSPENLGAIQMIECLKKAGMPIKDIQFFMEQTQKGDETLPARLAMFKRLRKQVEAQMQDLQRTLDMVNFKCDYYQTAVNDGTEKYVKENMNLNEFLNKKDGRI
ncbi:MAG: MerR family transcriptional regulator [Lactobacillus sp.]